jgi:hypothetical protein
MEEMLEELAAELPGRFYEELNGGVLLLPETRMSPEALDDDLYIMGEYRHSYSMGRYICMYYGSFAALYGRLGPEEIKSRLRETLRHEFTHHLESLAGEKDLEIEDERRLARYRYRAKKLKRLRARAKDGPSR